ncbi:hypothetical protein ACV229_40610 [Burkholderia sp. MR1-5-21]
MRKTKDETGGLTSSVHDPHGAQTRRSLIMLFACGALLGLGLAGYSLFTAKGTRTSAVPPEVMALVNGRPILRSDFVTQVQTQFSVAYAKSTPDQRSRVLDDMIAEELNVQRGVELDLPSFDPDVRAALVAGVEQHVLAQRPSQAIRVGAESNKEAREQVLRSNVQFLRGRADVQLSNDAKALPGTARHQKEGV